MFWPPELRKLDIRIWLGEPLGGNWGNRGPTTPVPRYQLEQKLQLLHTGTLGGFSWDLTGPTN